MENFIATANLAMTDTSKTAKIKKGDITHHHIV